MTALDKAIQDALTLNSTSWCPLFLRDGKIMVSEEENFPVAIQNISDKISLMPNGMIERKIQFYFCEPYMFSDPDVLGDIQPIYESLTQKVVSFIRELRNYNAKLDGSIEKLRDQTTLHEVGLFFTIKVEYRVCS
jgi:hypothetical protein